MDKKIALKRQLKKKSSLLSFRYRGKRTFVVVPGLNHPKSVDLSGVSGLESYEERMLFFLFLLKYKNTKIVYVVSKGFSQDLIDYYVWQISDAQSDYQEKISRLTIIEIDDDRKISLTQKILENAKNITRIKKAIGDPKTSFLRCYNPTKQERKLALKLGIPLFGSDQKFDFVGTKSGARKVFRLSKANVVPGISDISTFTKLCDSISQLAKKYPETKRMMIKRNYSSSGKGNCIFLLGAMLESEAVDLKKISKDDLTKLIKRNFESFANYQNPNTNYEEYKQRFNITGGIVELYIESENKYSPSTQAIISSNHNYRIVSTHEQILGGEDKQLYLGCEFPSLDSHRKLIIKEGEKIVGWLAKKGIVGNFAIDYVVTYDKDWKNPKVFPIEINLRKGGTTHPFRITYFLTGARYNKNTGLLQCGKVPIYYHSMDFIESEKYKKLTPAELIKAVSGSKISFNKDTKKGVLLFMPGMITEFGRFGAVCIGHSREEAKQYYKKLVKLINSLTA
jgi:hypothetical protein